MVEEAFVASATDDPADAGNVAISRVPVLVERLYALVAEMEALFPGRRFTPDGHLVGSIGEVIAAHRYGLTLRRASTRGHDAGSGCGREVEVKATQGRSVALREPCQHLIVLKLHRTGEATEIYNGPGASAWEAAGPMQRNGQRSIALSTLGRLMAAVPASERLLALR